MPSSIHKQSPCFVLHLTTPEKEKFPVELLKPYLAAGKRGVLSSLILSCVRNAWFGVRLVPELDNGKAQLKVGLRMNFSTLIRGISLLSSQYKYNLGSLKTF